MTRMIANADHDRPSTSSKLHVLRSASSDISRAADREQLCELFNSLRRKLSIAGLEYGTSAKSRCALAPGRAKSHCTADTPPPVTASEKTVRSVRIEVRVVEVEILVLMVARSRRGAWNSRIHLFSSFFFP